MSNIPEYVIGFDVETKDTLPTAKVLSLSGACIRVKDMQLVSCFDYIIDPNDASQVNRTESYATLQWHKNFGPERFKPTQRAYDITWGGHLTLDKSLKNIINELKAYKKSNHVITSCGPDFDMVILQDLARYYGMRYDIRYSVYDSVRTAKRGLDALGLPYMTDELLEAFPLLKDEDLRHTSRFDSLEEALITARYYNVLDSLNTNKPEPEVSTEPKLSASELYEKNKVKNFVASSALDGIIIEPEKETSDVK